MGTIWIKEFTGGLDAQRLTETISGGVLIKASNGHITSGGDFEKRAAFALEYTLPAAASKGIAADRTSVYVFGHDAAPSLPSGISYQRLQHPDGVTALDKVLDVELNAGKLYVVGQFVDGSIYHFYDGTRVTDWFDGRARASFEVTGGGVTSTIDIKVNGITLMSAVVTWATSNEATATAIAAAINSNTSSPDYTATAVGVRVNIIAATAGAASNGFAVTFTLVNSFTVSVPTGLVLANGADGSGTFQPGTYAKTFGSRLLSVSGPNFHLSGIKAPTKWTTETTGAGFIDMSSVAAGLEQLVAVAKYQEYVAIFAESATQIHYVESDPANSRPIQTLENTGTKYASSVVKFGDNDLFYVDGGVRSLKARDASNAASTTDIGVPIDPLVRAALDALTDADTTRVIGVIEPSQKRAWIIIKDIIFVFSYFAGARVSAWSTYSPGFTVDAVTIFNRRVYLRSGDNIYVYGGLGSTLEYDATVAEAWLPYLDAGDPTRTKNWTAIDAALTGKWAVGYAMQPTDPTVEDDGPTIVKTSYNQDRLPAIGASTHLSVRFRSSGTGAAKLGACVVHFEGEADED